MRFTGAAIAAVLLAGCGAQQDVAAQEAPAGTLLVANKRGNSLSRIDLATGQETHRAKTCSNPHELTVSPDRRYVMVACYAGTSVEAYEAADLSSAYVVELGDDARVHSAVWHADGRVVAGSEGRGSLFVIGGQHFPPPLKIDEIGGDAPGPHMVAVDENGTVAWGTIIATGAVVRYDLVRGREAGRRVLGGETEALALSPDGMSLWVGSNSADKIYRLDPDTLETVAEIAVGPTPIRIAAHPGGRWVATSNFGGGDISVIDTATNRVARTIAVSGSASAAQVTLVFGADGSRLYAAETATNTIAEIDFVSGRVLRRLPTGDGGDGLAVFE